MSEQRPLTRATSTAPGTWVEGHWYTSTACQHGLHDRCRRTCKFCEAKCRCNCHAIRGFYKPWEKR